MDRYDVIVIGGGPAGYHSAEYAAKSGLSVALFEQAELGGTCLNRGCIPTKSLLHSVRRYDLSAGPGSAAAGRAAFDQTAAIARKNETVEILVNGVAAGLRRGKVRIVKGEAGVSKAADAFCVTAGGESAESSHVLIATGSSPLIPEIEGVEEGIAAGNVLTSDEILGLESVPKSLLVIGGGVIGFEMASYFSDAGSEVTVVELLDHVLGACDFEIADAYGKEMERQGIRVITKRRLMRVRGGTAECLGPDGAEEIGFEKMLVCIGRKPNTAIKGLGSIGVGVKDGHIVTDGRCRTSAAGVYAIGDVAGTAALASVALREGEVAMNDILGRKDSIDYGAVCNTVFTHPEVAFVGVSEEQAKSAGMDYAVKKLSVNYSGRSVAEEGMSAGLCKLIIDKKKNTIAGAAVMSSYATEYIYSVALIIQNKIPVASILRTVFPHPTVCEIIRETLLAQ